jgi:hypothetical protein
MPALGASVAAMLAGWVLDGLIAPLVDDGTRLIAGLIFTTIVWFMVLRWLRRLRDG